MPSWVPAASPGTGAAAEDAEEETDSIRFTGRGDLEKPGMGQEVGVATEQPPRPAPSAGVFPETRTAVGYHALALREIEGCPPTEANTRSQEYGRGQLVQHFPRSRIQT